MSVYIYSKLNIRNKKKVHIATCRSFTGRTVTLSSRWMSKGQTQIAAYHGSLSLSDKDQILGLCSLLRSSTTGSGGGASSCLHSPPRESSAMASCKDAMEEQQNRVPSVKPPFTLSDIKKAVPKHCFQRSLLRSSSYLVADIVMVTILFQFARFVDTVAQPEIFRYLLWTIYWIAQGCIATGLWVIAHECGHRAFSDYALVDNLVGFVVHSSLLVPFFSWEYSHGRHHANNGSIHRDEVFVPKEKDGLSPMTPLLQHTPGRILSILFMLTLGWPSYLLFNVSGRRYPRAASHFDPNSPIFTKREQLYILLSDLGLVAAAAALAFLGWSYGFIWLIKVYGIPLLIVNGWLVTITYLQHTHVSLPHYADSDWDWIRGALVTVDRDYGILNAVFHHITDTHVVHHFFSSMPHYHAQEATEAVKSVLGRYYLCDKTPVLAAIWREYKECVFVEPDAKGEGVLWYKNDLS